jgi:hypothetical protein
MRSGQLMPADALTFDLEPGAMLYVPGAWVHSTEDLADSLSLNLSLQLRTWADLLMPVLRRYLVANRGWGDAVGSLLDTNGGSEDLVRQLQARLADLSKIDLADLALLESDRDESDEAPVRYRRNPTVRAWLRPGATGFQLGVEGPNDALAVWPVPDDQLAIYRWIAVADRPFGPDDLGALFSSAVSSADEIVGIVTRLHDAGFLISTD